MGFAPHKPEGGARSTTRIQDIASAARYLPAVPRVEQGYALLNIVAPVCLEGSLFLYGSSLYLLGITRACTAEGQAKCASRTGLNFLEHSVCNAFMSNPSVPSKLAGLSGIVRQNEWHRQSDWHLFHVPGAEAVDLPLRTEPHARLYHALGINHHIDLARNAFPLIRTSANYSNIDDALT